MSDAMAADNVRTKLDETDWAIVERFRADGRLSNAQVARSIGVSEATVRRRAARLVARRVLKFVALTNPRALGFDVEALIGLNVEFNSIERVGQKLSEFPEVRFLGLAMGALDILVIARFTSLDDWLSFRSSKLSQVEGIVRVETFQIATVMKRTYDWIFEGRHETAETPPPNRSRRRGMQRRSSVSPIRQASTRKASSVDREHA